MNNHMTVTEGQNVDRPTLPMRSRLREQMKLELREVALELFIEQGFDDVSSEQIAKKAGVSQRTFYRMFETKEEVLLAWLDHYAPSIMQALRDAPAALSPLEALRTAFIASTETKEPGRRERDMLVLRLINQSARLRASYSERVRSWARDIASILAERAGTTLSNDPSSAILAAAAFAATTAGNDWQAEFGSEDTLSDTATTLNLAFDRLGSLATAGSPPKVRAPRRKPA
jgi:AcrR family transcriptional regulator